LAVRSFAGLTWPSGCSPAFVARAASPQGRRWLRSTWGWDHNLEGGEAVMLGRLRPTKTDSGKAERGGAEPRTSNRKRDCHGRRLYRHALPQTRSKVWTSADPNETTVAARRDPRHLPGRRPTRPMSKRASAGPRPDNGRGRRRLRHRAFTLAKRLAVLVDRQARGRKVRPRAPPVPPTATRAHGFGRGRGPGPPADEVFMPPTRWRARGSCHEVFRRAPTGQQRGSGGRAVPTNVNCEPAGRTTVRGSSIRTTTAGQLVEAGALLPRFEKRRHGRPRSPPPRSRGRTDRQNPSPHSRRRTWPGRDLRPNGRQKWRSTSAGMTSISSGNTNEARPRGKVGWPAARAAARPRGGPGRSSMAAAGQTRYQDGAVLDHLFGQTWSAGMTVSRIRRAPPYSGLGSRAGGIIGGQGIGVWYQNGTMLWFYDPEMPAAKGISGPRGPRSRARRKPVAGRGTTTVDPGSAADFTTVGVPGRARRGVPPPVRTALGRDFFFPDRETRRDEKRPAVMDRDGGTPRNRDPLSGGSRADQPAAFVHPEHGPKPDGAAVRRHRGAAHPKGVHLGVFAQGGAVH